MTFEKSRKKTFSSIILCVFDAKTRNLVLNKLNINANRLNKKLFRQIKLNMQCIKCQKFGHHEKTCQTISKCQICELMHTTKSHICRICNSANACSHVSLKCANCEKSHQTNDSICEIIKAVASKKSIFDDEL